ncbi:STAS domain-containing protein [Streptomyces sp. A1547]|uniref:STAS domain-containing protein n=1 Tax=Streptomyces sp. A1547 TaxID=2563105 RepID=UPI00109E9F36|nr:STAS domain-containing protein [Streptomyces sp. A1547]THA39921.1 anti-sigma factor antagonist [Streptomyces sp. A1547]
MPQGPPPAAAIAARADGHLKVAVSGEIDILSAPQLRVTLEEAFSDGCRVVEVDFSGVEFCDCYGLGVLLEARRRAADQGTVLRLVSVTSPLVQRLLHHRYSGGPARPAPRSEQPKDSLILSSLI